ncbi:MAG: hypothetical protein GTN76_06670 [Candidatus Aenigmarchaeota archaeon]|nr:hypothetical protein [Candidatus Aenigmarchaeota archaeon]
MVEINSVKFGEITIDKKVYYSDMIVWWDGKIEYREKSHEFKMGEFLRLLEKKPEIIVVGTGMSGVCKVLEEVEQTAKDKGVEIFKDLSPKAAQMFNGFVADERRVVAVLHSTC